MPRGIPKIPRVAETLPIELVVPEAKPVDTTPEVKLEKKPELVTFVVDKEMTDGGIRINGRLYVGPVKVTQGQADDLARIQEEYFETKKKLMDKNVSVRMKNDFQKEALFLADPKIHAGKKGFTRDYGLLTPTEWSYIPEQFKQHLIAERRALYGY